MIKKQIVFPINEATDKIKETKILRGSGLPIQKSMGTYIVHSEKMKTSSGTVTFKQSK